MKVLESLRLRRYWEKFNYKLHIYWYLRGLLDELHSPEKLNRYLSYNPAIQAREKLLEIDLKNGIEAAEEQLDKLRPSGVKLWLDKQFVGTVPPRAGMEQLRGVHLRRLLATDLSLPLLKAMALEKLMNETIETEHHKV